MIQPKIAEFSTIRRSLLVASVAAALASGCRTSSSAAPQTASDTSPPPAPTVTATEPAPPPSSPSPENPLPISSTPSPVLPAPRGVNNAADAGAPPPLEGRVVPSANRGALLIPPAKAGAFTVALAGCVAEEGTESASRSAGAPGSEAGTPASSVVVSATGTGIIVAHELTHACCLKARVSASVQGSNIQVSEQLSGNPCRCLCQSTLKTAVGLKPGNYKLSVRLTDPNGPRTVHQEPISIPAAPQR